jgi:hypothetical protein
VFFYGKILPFTSGDFLQSFAIGTNMMPIRPLRHASGGLFALQIALVAAVFALGLAGPAQAWILNVTPGARTVYLAVGNATANAGNATVNTVSTTLLPAEVGTGLVKAMTSTSTQSASPYDGYAVCTPATGQVYVGGFYRLPASNATTAVLQVATPAGLTNGAFSIPFNQISWTSTALGNATADIPPGTFVNGGSVTLASFGANKYVENCHSFNYANTAAVAAGTYTGQATYTLTAP